MSTFDIIVLVPLLFGAYKGYTKGLLIELTNMLAFVLAIILSFKLLNVAIGLVISVLGNIGSIVPFLAFILVFILVIIGVSTLGKIVKKVVDFTLIGYLDDIAGGLLGVLKWGFAMSLVVWLLSQAQIALPTHWIQDSVIYPYLVVYGPKLIDVVSTFVPFASDLIGGISELFN